MVFGLFDGSTYRLTTYRLIDVAPLGRSCDGLILAHPLQAIRMASKLTLFKHGALGADGVGNGRRKGPLQELGMCLPEPGSTCRSIDLSTYRPIDLPMSLRWTNWAGVFQSLA